MSTFQIVLALVAIERGAEALLAIRNTRQLRRRGAVEAGHKLCSLATGLQALWLLAMLAFLPANTTLDWPLLWAFLAALWIRIAVVSGLGPMWTARLLADPDAPLAAGLSYRSLRHIPYLLLLAEMTLLPLACGGTQLAGLFCLLLAVLLALRIRAEDAALASRRRVLDHLAGWRVRTAKPSPGYNLATAAAPARIRRLADGRR